MKYLLDVNALIAWRHGRSPHHATFHAWIARIGTDSLATCAQCELGFIRVSMQAFGYSLERAQDALAAIKRQTGGFLDTAPSPRRATWADTAAKTSDAYLTQIAHANGLTLATLDQGIPAAELIR